MGSHCSKNTVEPISSLGSGVIDLKTNVEKKLHEYENIRMSNGENEFCNLHLTSSVINEENLRQVGISSIKSCVIVLTISMILPTTTKRKNLKFKDVTINWGELSIVKQFPDKTLIVERGVNKIYAILDQASSQTSEITMTITYKKQKVTIATNVSAAPLATEGDIVEFARVYKQNKMSSKDKRRRYSFVENVTSLASSIEDLGKQQTDEEITDMIEESYFKEYGMKIKRRVVSKKGEKQRQRSDEQSTKKYRKRSSHSDTFRRGGGQKDSQNIDSISDIVVLSDYNIDKPSRSTESAISQASFGDFSRTWNGKSSLESICNRSRENSISSITLSDQLKLNDISNSPGNSTQTSEDENRYKRPQCPTPNSKSDLSWLRNQSISESPSPTNLTRQRRPTPIVVHVVSKNVMKSQRKRRKSPSAPKYSRKISEGQFSLTDDPLIEENEENDEDNSSHVNSPVQVHISYVSNTMTNNRGDGVEESVQSKISILSAAESGRSSDVLNVDVFKDDRKGEETDKDISYALKMVSEIQKYDELERERRKSYMSERVSCSSNTTVKKTFRRTKSMPVINLGAIRRKTSVQ